MAKKANNKLRILCRDYLLARKKFREIADKIPELAGNDNIIGRIGEFIALQFLRDICRRTHVVRNENPVEAGYDILADGKKVSVKIITSENENGRITRIKDPWNELVLIEIDYVKILRIGFLERETLVERKMNQNPIAKRSMLNDHGTIGKYGKVYTGDRVEKYLQITK